METLIAMPIGQPVLHSMGRGVPQKVNELRGDLIRDGL